MHKKSKLTPKQQRDADYAKWLAGLKSQKTSFARTTHAAPSKSLSYSLDTTGPRNADLKKFPSRATPGGSTAKLEDKKYTGTNMLGIGDMHKSNAVPVFQKEAAHDLAKMRR